MIVTEAQLTMLRKGAVQIIEIPARQPAPGARAPRPPVTVGKSYGAQLAPFTRSKMRVIVHGLELAGGVWRATVKAGEIEKPRFLAARPGRRGDYVTDERYAMREEPECVPESWERTVARAAARMSEPRDPRGRDIRERRFRPPAA
jgi:hypothetical protein